MLSNVTSEEWGYIAGLIDGEGSISITRGIRKDRPKPYERTYAKLNIYSCSEVLMGWLKCKVGGNVYRTALRNPLWKDGLNWTASPSLSCDILEACLPMLVIKRRQAELFVEFFSTSTLATSGRRSGVAYSVLQRREEMYTEWRALNKRGREANA